ncbi:glycosyltransferase [Lutibacter sp. A64]|uniref:glycosyltransferase n=1 Tax=Lutibacter sp. A64 TaxID=2918526 RepID=UPI001F066451|nr:glycosyltransferase [Lutibacter sp. A64]UMB55465.1 glycosyltransferase [Lutibacter sp. A64]
MKKILFFVESLHCGGAERSLLSLLNNLDYSGYEVRLMVLKKGGEFEQFVPKHLTIESVAINLSLIARIKFKIARVLNFKEKTHNAQLFWKIAKNKVPKLDLDIDIAIAWGQGFATYFVAEKIMAKKKFAWVNIDFAKAGYNIKIDTPIYNKFDKIVGVSVFVKESMQKFIPPNKVISIRNIIDKDDILKRAEDKVSIKFSTDSINIVSIGRLAIQKGFELSVQAAKILSDLGFNFRWYIIGEGNERAYLEKLIKELNLENKFILLGFRDNPYPYVKMCDVYVQTSHFEGLGRTLIEASILNKPIVTTNFPTAYSILEQDKTGVITEMNSKSIAGGIEKIMTDLDFKNYLIKNLEEQQDNQKEKTLREVKNLIES